MGAEMSQVNERGILFSGEMVRAILDGRKTQTRRVAKLTASGRIREPGSQRNWHTDDPQCVNGCPYGMPGDRLWVRETWASDGAQVWYKADTDPGPANEVCEYPNGAYFEGKWKPSIHMPSWASRILLEITDVRVERLHDISEEDARAEGFESRKDFLSGEWAMGIQEKHKNPWVWVIKFQKIAQFHTFFS